jgi:carbamoyl-phosphate synthase large subunit
MISSGLGSKTSVLNNSGRVELGSRLVISSGISQGLICNRGDVIAQCKDIAVALGSRGPLNIQGRLVGGLLHVFEINPRHSGTTAGRALCGVNEPEIMIRLGVLNEKIEKVELLSEGWVLRGLDEVLIKLPRSA